VGAPVSAAANGAYTITGVPDGTYTIEVSLSGYITGTITGVTVSGANVSDKDLVLQRPDGTPPGKVTGIAATEGDGQVVLTWKDPADSDLDEIEITWEPGSGSGTALKAAGTYTATGLTNATEYTFTVKAVDTSGNKSEAETVKATPKDLTPPGKVTGLVATAGNTIARLTWKDPADADLASIEITFTPVKTGVTQPVSVPKGTEIAVIEGLDNDTEYTFTVKAKDAAGNLGAGETGTAEPKGTLNSDLTPPGTVTALDAASGDGQVILTWTDPADTDGDLAGIEITWEPGSGSGTAATGTETYTATGLTNGIAYAFTVKAVDNATPNPNTSEAATASVTPHAAAQVTVTFTALPQDETITLTGGQNLSWSANDALTVAVSETFSAYRWVLDGDGSDPLVTGQTASSLTLDAEDLTVKQHELTVFVTTGGSVEYAKRLIFTVTL
jgi:chitodextrinase